MEYMPDETAQDAYDKGHFMEAIQHLHGFIENQASAYLILFGSVYYGSKQEDIWDLKNLYDSRLLKETI